MILVYILLGLIGAFVIGCVISINIMGSKISKMEEAMKEAELSEDDISNLGY